MSNSEDFGNYEEFNYNKERKNLNNKKKEHIKLEIKQIKLLGIR